jgi:glycosyltransferase involved in cell wall biosynthesis
LKKFSIALIHYSCPPLVGGVEEIIRQQAALFHRYAHPVKVLAGAGNRFRDDFTIEINPLLSSRNPKVLNLYESMDLNNQLLNHLTDQIFEYLVSAIDQFDFLLAHNVLTMHYNLPLTYAIHQLANTDQIKVVSWNHDSPHFYKNFDIDLNRDPWGILKCYNSNIHYVTISERRKTEFSKIFGTKCPIQVIENGIDPIRFFRLDPDTVQIIKEKNLFAADFIMVQPSRLHPRKNIELSIKVIKALHDKGLRAILLASGAYDPHEEKSLPYYEKLMRLAISLNIQDEILMLAEYTLENGQEITTDRIMMRDLYHIADALFLPSKQEGFGIPILEAAMIKLPVFCSDIPPFKTIGKDQVYYFSLSDTPEQIADLIINNLDQLKQHRMFRHVIKNYVWDNIYDKSIKPYLEGIYQADLTPA